MWHAAGWFVFTPILSESPTSPNSDFQITKNELADFYHQQIVTLKLRVATLYQMETKDDELLIITKFLFPTEVESSFPQIQVLVQPRYLAADHYWLLVPGGKKSRNFRPKWAVKWTWLIIKKPLILEDSQDTSIIHVCRIKYNNIYLIAFDIYDLIFIAVSPRILSSHITEL